METTALPPYTVHVGDGLLTGPETIKERHKDRRSAQKAAERLVSKVHPRTEVRFQRLLMDLFALNGRKARHIYEHKEKKQ